jgi:hypothetical protein
MAGLVGTIERVARPRKDASGEAATERKQIVAAPRWVSRVEDWRASQRPVPSWGEAVRMLVDEALDARERTKPKPD